VITTKAHNKVPATRVHILYDTTSRLNMQNTIPKKIMIDLSTRWTTWSRKTKVQRCLHLQTCL